MKIKFLSAVLLLNLAGLLFISNLYAEENDFSVSGYYKNLFISSKSSVSEENIFSDTQRLRLEFKKQVEAWQFFMALDNEAILNDFSNTPDFGIVRSKTQDQLAAWDLDKTSVDNDHLYLRHSVYRAYVQYYSPQFQAVLGKQAIDWGRMRFYSPLDVFNPTGPIDIEPQERVGVDAINLNFSPQNFAGINAIVAPSRDGEETSFGMKLYKSISPNDYALIAARIKKNTVAGFSFDGYLKDAGFRGEITFNQQDNEKSFTRVSIGGDYNFNPKLYFLLEQFYNGGHEDNNIGAFTSSYSLARQILSIKKNLTSAMLKYSVTPLIDASATTIYDWSGKSVVVNPEVKFNTSSNTDIAVGTQLFFGKDDSEFGSYQHFIYAEFKWFF